MRIIGKLFIFLLLCVFSFNVFSMDIWHKIEKYEKIKSFYEKYKDLKIAEIRILKNNIDRMEIASALNKDELFDNYIEKTELTIEKIKVRKEFISRRKDELNEKLDDLSYYIGLQSEKLKKDDLKTYLILKKDYKNIESLIKENKLNKAEKKIKVLYTELQSKKVNR